MRSAYDALRACTPTASAKCRYLDQQFHDKYGATGFLGPVLLLLPGLIGAFVGAPLLARELETGTFRYAWTQGVGRMRWAVALIVPGAVGIAVVMGAFGALVSWHQQPLDRLRRRSRLEPSIFPTTGLAVAGWTLAASPSGCWPVCSGAESCRPWQRRSPLWFGLAYLAVPVSAHRLPRAVADRRAWTCRPATCSSASGGPRAACGSASPTSTASWSPSAPTSAATVSACTSAQAGSTRSSTCCSHGYQQVTTYQPARRYWTFQWIEFGWLTALAVILLGIDVLAAAPPGRLRTGVSPRGAIMSR